FYIVLASPFNGVCQHSFSGTASAQGIVYFRVINYDVSFRITGVRHFGKLFPVFFNIESTFVSCFLMQNFHNSILTGRTVISKIKFVDFGDTVNNPLTNGRDRFRYLQTKKMRTSIILYLMGRLLLSGYAQIELTSLSAEAEFRKTVGYTNFTVKSGRPSVRGRTIMGDLVPFGKLWRTGGGPPSIINFDRDVVIG